MITKYPSILLADPKDVSPRNMFAYDIGSPVASLRTKPLIVDISCALIIITKKNKGIYFIVFIRNPKKERVLII